MKPRQPLVLPAFLLAIQLRPDLDAEALSQKYDYAYQLYQEDDDRIRIASHYVRGQVELDEATGVRFQALHDAISGASPTGALPGGIQPFTQNLEDARFGILGALSRQFGDHRIELEASRSSEDDYTSHGYSLSDKWELNQKNTTVSFGLNHLDDKVIVPILGDKTKKSYDLFTGVSQVLGRNTVVSANFTVGFAEGYLNDPYKVVQRTDIVTVPDGLGGTIDIPVDNIYRENRPDSRLREVVQLQATHFFPALNAAVDGVYRLSNDDYGVLSHTVQLEWRQSVGDKLTVTPYVRHFSQGAADFFFPTIDGVVPAAVTPAADPDGSGINYSSDYRLSSLETLSLGLKVRCQLTDAFNLTASFERYEMGGRGSRTSPSQAYPDASLWTVGVGASF